MGMFDDLIPSPATGGRVPASIRNNNPGAQWPGQSAARFGSSDYEVLNDGQGNKIARFDSPEAGAAAQFDLLNRKYTGMTVRDAIRKWSGGNSSDAYAASVSNAMGISPNDVLSPDILADPSRAIPFARAMARVEAGRDFPMSDDQWTRAHQMAFADAGQQPAGVSAINAAEAKPQGLIEPGNIDLTKRPIVKNADGSISTVRSIGVNFDGREYLLPTVSDDGRILSDDQAVDLFRKTGRHLGVFDTPQNSTRYAENLHVNQERMYMPGAASGKPAQAARPPAGGMFDDLIPGQGAAPKNAPLRIEIVKDVPGPDQVAAIPDASAVQAPQASTDGPQPGINTPAGFNAAFQSFPDPAAMDRPPENALSASTQGVLQGLTMGFGDELMAGMLTPIEMGMRAYKGEDWSPGASYDAALAREREGLARAKENYPIASTVGDVAGSLMTGSALSKGGATLLNVAKPSAGGMIARGAAEGAVYGAARGAGEGEGVDGRVQGAATGGVIGAVAGGTIGALAAGMSSNAAKKLVASAEQLKAKGEIAYKAADAAGVSVTPQSLSRLGSTLAADLRQVGYSPRLHPRVAATLEELSSLPQQPTSLRDVEIIRRIANNARMSADPSEQMIGGKMVDAIDDFLVNLTPADVTAGNSGAAVKALKEARQYWGQYRRMDKVEQAIYKAENRAASTGAGGNAENAIRQNIRAILDKGAPGFTDAEKAAMEKVVRGGSLQNIARLIGKFAPTGAVSSVLSGGAGLAAGGPVGAIALPTAGFAGKKLAETLAQKNVQTLLNTIASGGQLPAMQQLTAQQAEALGSLLQALAQESAAAVPKAVKSPVDTAR